MILLYCFDIDERFRIHDYFREKGIRLESVSPSEFRIRSYALGTDAILIAGEALPHRTQQKIAVSRVTGNHDQMTRVCCCASLTAIKTSLRL